MDFKILAFLILVLCLYACVYRALTWCKGVYVRFARFLGLRPKRRCFTREERMAAYRKQGGRCAMCGRWFDFNAMEGDHVIPFSRGGKTETSNLQMLCRTCNRSKGNR